ncbi:MAG: NADH-quinone oxidoreductase subunit NuoE [Treponema sp.]|nr:NADH-quinone oxidoreductase subunit NuoE [Treponema sp.]
MILPRERLLELFRQYPRDRRFALAVFQDVQRQCGYLPKEHIEEAAEYLNIPLSQVYSMVTFYHSLSLEPRGKHLIRVCDGTTCHIRGSMSVLDYLKQLLGIEPGDTDADGLFTIETVACLGTCALAPVMQIGEEYFGKLDENKISEIIAQYRKNETAGVTS